MASDSTWEPSEEIIAVVKEKLVPLVGDTMSLTSVARALAQEFGCRASDLMQLALKIKKGS
jgi:hypothetical protein